MMMLLKLFFSLYLSKKELLVVRLHTIFKNIEIVHDINPDISWSIPARICYCYSPKSEHWTLSFRRHHCFNCRKQPFSLLVNICIRIFKTLGARKGERETSGLSLPTFIVHTLRC